MITEKSGGGSVLEHWVDWGDTSRMGVRSYSTCEGVIEAGVANPEVNDGNV